MRWPGKIKPGTVNNNICSHEDMLPTILAAAGEPDVKEKLLTGHKAIGRNYKVHLDGYNLLPGITGEDVEWPRQEFFYWTDDGNLCALRYNRWKLVFLEQRGHGFDVWQEPFVPLRLPKLFCLKTDPFERADHEAMDYGHWRFERVFALIPAQAFVAKHLATYVEFPPRSKPGSFALDDVLSALQAGATPNN
jgi:arylsulfatase